LQENQAPEKQAPEKLEVSYQKVPHSAKQRFTQALFDSIPVTSFILLLVIVHVILMVRGVENESFEW
jgi:hypothetical protein